MLLLENPTRIIQVNGLLFINFLFGYFSDGQWRFAGGGGGFKIANLKFPNIEGKEKEYRSPSVYA